MALQALSLRSSSPGIEFADMPRATWLDPQIDGLINPQIKSSLLGTVENASTHSTHSTFRSRDSTLEITPKTLKFPQVQPSKIFGLPAMKFCSFSMGRNRIFRPFEARRSTSSLALRLEARRPGLKLPQSEGR